MTRVGKDGSVLTLQSDGIRNKMSRSELNGGTDISSLNSIDDVLLNSKTDENGRLIERVGYSYTDYYQQQISSGAMKESDVPLGMFMHKGKDGIIRDEYGEVVRDAKGASRGGAFARYMRESNSSWMFAGGESANQGKNRWVGKTKQDMSYFFGNTSSGRSKGGMFFGGK